MPLRSWGTGCTTRRSSRYIYEATESAGWVGAATICRLLPYVLLGPLGGVVADRYDRRTVLLAGDVIRGSMMLALALAVSVDGPVWLVIAITALASAAGTAERPAAMALLPRLVGETRLGAANALLHTVQDLGVVVGPALGAVLLFIGPPEGAFLANAVTFGVSAPLISRLHRRPSPSSAATGQEGAVGELRHGLRTAWTTPFVAPLLIVVCMAELTYGAQTVQLVLYAERRLDLGAEGYGYLLAAAGVGGLLSAVVNHRLAASSRVSAIVVGFGGLFCATQVAYARTDALVLALAITVLGGVGIVACEVVAETALARVLAVGRDRQGHGRVPRGVRRGDDRRRAAGPGPGGDHLPADEPRRPRPGERGHHASSACPRSGGSTR